MASRLCSCSASSLSALTRRRGYSAPSCAAACSRRAAARWPASSRWMKLKLPAAAKTIRSRAAAGAAIRAKCWLSAPSRSKTVALVPAASASAKSPITRPPASMPFLPPTSPPAPPPRPMAGPGIPAPPASSPTIPTSSARWPPISSCPGFTASSPTSRSGPWASTTGCAASTSNPTSMNLQPPAHPTCRIPIPPWHRRRAAAPSLQDVDLTGSSDIRLSRYIPVACIPVVLLLVLIAGWMFVKERSATAKNAYFIFYCGPLIFTTIFVQCLHHESQPPRAAAVLVDSWTQQEGRSGRTKQSQYNSYARDQYVLSGADQELFRPLRRHIRQHRERE